MSDAREWRFYLKDMIRFCEKVLSYSAEMSRATLESDSMRFDAIVRNLELIGEAARNIPESVRSEVPDVPWRMIIATRNRLIHGYLGIDNDTLWSIIQGDIPRLHTQLCKWQSQV